MKDFMKKQWKKIAAAILAIVMVVGVIPANSLLSYATSEGYPNDFSVTVNDAQGNALNGVDVSIQAGEPLAEVTKATTAQDKGCAFEGITDGSLQSEYGLEYTIVCSKDGYVSESKEIVVDVKDKSNIEVVMYRSVDISGVVKASGELQENATVKYMADNGIVETVVTDAEGKFSFTNVKKGNNPRLIIALENASTEVKEYTLDFENQAVLDCGEIECTSFVVTFSAKNGVFQDEKGKTIEKLEVPYNGNAAFKFVPNKGYSATVFDGNIKLTASNDVYTIANVKEAHNITVQTLDIGAPTIDAIVSADWAQSKTITYLVSDNETGKVKFYVSRNDYADLAALVDAGLEECDTTQTVKENGFYYAYAVDEANNFAKKTVEVQKIDSTAPELTIEYETEENSGFIKILNKLTFGLLFKEKITITVKAVEDENDSGIQKYQYQVVEDGQNVDKDKWVDITSNGVIEQSEKATTEILMNDVTTFLGKVYVRVFDNAGNETVGIASSNGKTTILVSHFEGGEIKAEPVGYTPGTWTKNDVSINLRPVEADIITGGVEKYEYSVDGGKWNEAGIEVNEENDTATFVIASDINAEYKFRALYNNGNYSDESVAIKVQVDKTQPEDLKVLIDGENDEKENATSTGVIEFSEYYYSSKITLRLEASDTGSGIGSIEYFKVPASTDPTKWPEKDWITYDAKGIVIEPNDKCIIYMRVKDSVGNEPAYAHSKGIIVDNEKPVGDLNAADIKINIETQPQDNGFFTSDVRFNVQVQDPAYIGDKPNNDGYYSGLKSVEYKIEALDGFAAVGELINDLGALQDPDTKTPTNGDLIQTFSQDIVIPAKRFDSNKVKITIIATDNAGNSRPAEKIIQIDASNPEVTVSYDNNEADSDKYFKTTRKATVAITERNFPINEKGEIDEGRVKIEIGATLNGADIEQPTVTWAHNGDVHTATIVYAADGDYTFGVKIKDLAGNETMDSQYVEQMIASGEKTEDEAKNIGRTDYGKSVAPKEFVVDNFDPEVTVTYDNNSAKNEKYFKEVRTATVIIEEHNFPINEKGEIDEERVDIEIHASLNGVNIEGHQITWEHEGDVHTATIAYEADGDYTFEITVTDWAGRTEKEVDYKESVAANEFTIDTKIDNNGKAIIGGVANGKAYKEVAIPTVEFTDVNLESYELHLYRTQRGERNVDITSLANLRAMVTMDAQTGKGSFDIFKKLSSGIYDQSDDGIYRLTITMTDKAGNTSDVETVNFTINRFGSVYEYSEYLSDLIKDGGKYVKNIDKDLVITEYNPDRLVQDTLHIEITRDGKPIDDVEYDVTPVINNQVSVGDSGWYQYQYTIKKSNFAEDGVYKISVSSKDATGNSPETNNYEEQDILFRVDDTLPEITSIVGLEKAIVNAEEQEVKYTIFDVIGLKSIKVYVNGKLIQEIKADALENDANNYEGSFVLEENKKAYNVQILVEDLAGNITDTSSEEFTSAYEFTPKITVSTNFFVRWYANKFVFWGSIAGLAVVLGAVVALIVGKRKKEEELNIK